ncbi:hypothetical protein SAMN02746066_04657 [Anaerosporobacter mobilis DSM 15930]|jgi:hypothetical protein|uniref:Uncharacterized protein n=1 Tax=Anaerosporobacter mobilis DSM 15930 TaxID=1120996 RepID=A0A1M7NPV1_9FIRM|nr:hypothetical protein [Anaerosporobacter mobilis]SHN05965.1 hypothetical protein SAMN02746066_04657 [Anaerosporobacter mobilis DSM 15930]
MKTNKIIAMTLLIAMSLTSITPNKAQAQTKEYTPEEVRQVEVQYPNIVINDVDSQQLNNTNSICVNSLEEYNLLLEKLSTYTTTHNSNQNILVINNSYDNPTYDITRSNPVYTSDVYTTPVGAINLVPPVYMNIQFDYTTGFSSVYKKYFTSITNVNSWTTGVQIPVGFSWEQKSSSYTLSNQNRNVSVTVSGVMEVSVLFEGLGKIVEIPASFTGSWVVK